MRSVLTRTRGIALALALTAGVAGCGVNSPVQTAETAKYPADGVPVDLGSVQVRNLVLISGKAGGEAVVTGTVENTSAKPATLTIGAEGGPSVTARVPAGQLVNLSTDGPKVTLSSLEAAPGAMAPMQVGTSGENTQPIEIPVLEPTGYYEQYAPKGYTPSPSETTEAESESEGDSGH